MSGNTYALTHDAENRLVGVSGAITAAFKYNGDGNRLQGTVAGVTTTYIGSYYEWTSAGSTQYYYSGSQRIAMRRSGCGGDNGLFWVFGDHLGSTSVTANSAGGYISEVRYKAWGETRFTWGSTPTTFRFTGQREQAELGLYFYNARWYDAALGRFIQADSIVPQPGNSQAWDRYSYTLNNPLRYVDPSGHGPKGVSPFPPELFVIGIYLLYVWSMEILNYNYELRNSIPDVNITPTPDPTFTPSRTPKHTATSTAALSVTPSATARYSAATQLSTASSTTTPATTSSPTSASSPTASATTNPGLQSLSSQVSSNGFDIDAEEIWEVASDPFDMGSASDFWSPEYDWITFLEMLSNDPKWQGGCQIARGILTPLVTIINNYPEQPIGHQIDNPHGLREIQTPTPITPYRNPLLLVK